jgi:hypothetical protein
VVRVPSMQSALRRALFASLSQPARPALPLMLGPQLSVAASVSAGQITAKKKAQDLIIFNLSGSEIIFGASPT